MLMMILMTTMLLLLLLQSGAFDRVIQSCELPQTPSGRVGGVRRPVQVCSPSCNYRVGQKNWATDS